MPIATNHQAPPAPLPDIAALRHDNTVKKSA
jgi:hypothetical protein